MPQALRISARRSSRSHPLAQGLVAGSVVGHRRTTRVSTNIASQTYRLFEPMLGEGCSTSRSTCASWRWAAGPSGACGGKRATSPDLLGSMRPAYQRLWRHDLLLGLGGALVYRSGSRSCS